jgi:hypothetical protein
MEQIKAKNAFTNNLLQQNFGIRNPVDNEIMFVIIKVCYNKHIKMFRIVVIYILRNEKIYCVHLVKMSKIFFCAACFSSDFSVNYWRISLSATHGLEHFYLSL